jgi:hypothetical protein
MTLMQGLGVAEHIIERIANHVEQNRMKRTYQHYSYDQEKLEAWRELGKLLAKLTAKNGEPTRPFSAK